MGEGSGRDGWCEKERARERKSGGKIHLTWSTVYMRSVSLLFNLASSHGTNSMQP